MTGTPCPLSSCELDLWMSYRQNFGLAVDRLEWTTANGASAVCHTFGGAVPPSRIVAKFTHSKPSPAKVAYSLAALPGAKVTFRPRDGGPILEGKAALAMLDRKRPDDDDAEDDDDKVKPARKRTLDSRPKDRQRPKGKRTLDG